MDDEFEKQIKKGYTINVLLQRATILTEKDNKDGNNGGAAANYTSHWHIAILAQTNSETAVKAALRGVLCLIEGSKGLRLQAVGVLFEQYFDSY